VSSSCSCGRDEERLREAAKHGFKSALDVFWL
jgi:hypothetical protein